MMAFKIACILTTSNSHQVGSTTALYSTHTMHNYTKPMSNVASLTLQYCYAYALFQVCAYIVVFWKVTVKYYQITKLSCNIPG